MKPSQPPLRIEPAKPGDAELLVQFVRELAEFERLLHAVRISPEDLRRDLFGPHRYAEAAVAWVGTDAVGFALWFHNYSTFAGRPGLYLEDLYIRPAFRGHGFGEAMLKYLAALALERGCARFEWSVLDWNEKAIGFYQKLGAVAMDDWTVYRIDGPALARLAGVAP